MLPENRVEPPPPGVSPSSWKSRISRHAPVTFYGFVIVFAALLRFGPIASGLPYSDYVDEGYVLHQVIHLFARHNLDTGWYGYPPLPAYLTATTVVATGPFYRHAHGHSFRRDLPPERDNRTSAYNYDFVSPPELIVAGRFVTAALSVATVALIGIIAARSRNQAAGLVAVLISAVCPALVVRASNVIVDTPATFFAVLTLYFCQRLAPDGARRRWSVASAGFSAGLALASKYTAGAVFVAVLTAIWVLPKPKKTRAGLSFLASFAFFSGVALGAPTIFLRLQDVMRDLTTAAAHYETIHSDPGYFGQAVQTFELGWPLAIAGSAGIVLMFQDGTTRRTAVGWCLFGGALLAPLLGKSFQPFRNLLPLVPLLCIGAALLFSKLIDWAHDGPFRRLRLALVVAAIGTAIILPALSSVRFIRQRISHRDTRVEAIDWLRQHVKKGETVLAIRELAILPAEWKQVAAKISVVSWTEAVELLDRQQFDYVVVGDLDLRYAPNTDLAAQYLARWKNRTASFVPVSAFGSNPTFVVPYLWRTNDELIRIFKIP